MPKKITLSDIASSLGVSKTLVSMVINNKADQYGISKETQKRVRKKVTELNFQPNVLARGFRTGKTNTIGLIVSDISNIFYARIARKIEDYAWKHGYSVVICSTDEDIEKEKDQIRMLRGRKVDGMIISSSMEDASFFNQLHEVGVPHVLIDRTFPDMNSANVSVDNYGGGRLAALHLLSQGYTRAAILAIAPEHISTINDRLLGFKSAFEEAGISIPDYWNIRAPFNKIEDSVNENLERLHLDNNLPQAIFSLNNNLTTQCLSCLRELSIDVPGQVALIGFDSLVHYTVTTPSISALQQPIDQIGERAFDLLLRQIKETKIAKNEWSAQLPVDLIVRESSIRPSGYQK
ncbi:MAG: LacI family DNA-binding transcriptional regulator [Lentimicrobium sp.]|jgi:LacI family transcriptional regulator|nr:LacI family DNA-binding transcriptional regulator [Lentimicrobium sp.]